MERDTQEKQRVTGETKGRERKRWTREGGKEREDWMSFFMFVF